MCPKVGRVSSNQDDLRASQLRTGSNHHPPSPKKNTASWRFGGQYYIFTQQNTCAELISITKKFPQQGKTKKGGSGKQQKKTRQRE